MEGKNKLPVNNFENTNQPSYSEAMLQIGMKQQEAMVMGANDFESSAFDVIRKKLTDGEMTPAEAVKKAFDVVEGKQDYH